MSIAFRREKRHWDGYHLQCTLSVKNPPSPQTGLCQKEGFYIYIYIPSLLISSSPLQNSSSFPWGAEYGRRSDRVYRPTQTHTSGKWKKVKESEASRKWGPCSKMPISSSNTNSLRREKKKPWYMSCQKGQPKPPQGAGGQRQNIMPETRAIFT